MAELTLNVTLTADGSGFVGEVKVAKGELDRLTGAQAAGGQAAARAARDTKAYTREVNGASSAAAAATRIFAALGGAFAVQRIVRTADDYKLLEGRLRLVTGSSRELAQVQAELLALANGTRSAFQPTVELYARVARNAAELGLSQRALLETTLLVNQSIRIGGSTATEASAGVLQFSQALASGTLRGDELRSVLENMPRLAQAISNGLGVTLGDLRRLSEEGKLTAQSVIDALLGQRAAIEREFGQLPVTVGQAFTVLGNQVGDFIAGADKATGATSALANGILGVADNVELLVAGVAGLAAAGALPLLLRLAPLFAGLASPIGLAALSVGALTAGIVALALRTSETERVQERFNGLLREARRNTEEATEASGARAEALDGERRNLVSLAEAEIAVAEARLATTRLVTGATEFSFLSEDTSAVKDATKAFREARQSLLVLRAALGEFDGGETLRLAQILGGGARDTSSAATKKFLDDLRFEASLIGKTSREREIAIAFRKAETTAASEQGREIARLTGVLFDEERAQRLNADATQRATEAAERQLRDREAAIARGQEIVKQETALTRALEAEAEAARKRIALAGADERTRRVELRLLEEQNAARARGLPLLGEEIDKRRELIGEIVDAELLAEQAERAAELMQEPFKNAINGIQGAFTDFFEDVFSGGIDSFSDLASGIKRIFIRMLAEMATLAIVRQIVVPVIAGLAGALGSGGGGALGGGGLASGGLLGQLGGAGNLFGLGFPAGDFSILNATGLGGLLSTSLIAGAPGGAPLLTVGGLLGGAALGFGAGTFLNSLVGGNPTGGLIGSGGGALAGAAIGSIIPGVGTIVGGLIGGAGGGLLGGLFGNNKPTNAATAAVFDFGAGGISTTSHNSPGKSTAQTIALRDAVIAGVTQNISAILGATGGQLNIRSLSVELGQRDATLVRVGGQGAFPGRGGEVFRGPVGDAGFAIRTAVRELLAGGLTGVTAIIDQTLRRSAAIREDPNEIVADLQLAQTIESLRTGATALTGALDQLTQGFAAATRRAKELGLPVEDLVDNLRQGAAATVGGFFDVLSGPLRAGAAGLRFSGLAPGDQVDALRGDFLALQASSGAGNIAAIQALPAAGLALVQAAEAAFAPAGPALAAIREEVATVFADTADDLEAERGALFERFDLAIEAQTNTLADRIDEMIAGLERIAAAIAEAQSPVAAIAPLAESINRTARAVETAVIERRERDGDR